MKDSLTENIRKEAPRQMMLADDMVLCARMIERRAGVRTEAEERSLESNESV